MTATPPIAARKPYERVLHGDVVADPYEWMREKTNPEVIDHLNAEMAYTLASTQHLEALTTELYDEIKARTQETDLSVPTLVKHTSGAYWYYARTQEGKDYAVHCRVPATDEDQMPDLSGEITDEQILLDGNAEAEGHEFFSLGAFETSPDGTKLAWLVDNAGDERYALFVKDLASGEIIDSGLDDLFADLVWAGDDWLVYTRCDAAWRPHQLWRHRVGGDAQQDTLLYQEDDEKFWMGAWASKDETMLLIGIGSKMTGEMRYLPIAEIEHGTPAVLAPREPGISYAADWAGDRFLIWHNADCIDYTVAQAPADATSREQWETVIEGVEGVRIAGVSPYRDHVVISMRRDGLTQVHLVDRDEQGNLLPGRDMVFDEAVRTVHSTGSPNWDTDRIRLVYGSLLTPTSVLEYRFDDGSLTELKRQAVLDDPQHGAYDPDLYVQKREWATAADGTLVPISVVHRKDLVLDGTNPTLLYGYGSYETCIDPNFSIARLALLERGFVFAIAHIRGGGEMGRGWYEHGKFLEKKNTFTDFVDCAKHLIAQGYTSPEHLAAEGRSAGGLLMGAVTNLAPELFRCVHAGVPFVDALTSMVMPELPLTIGEWEEWGDPFHDPEYYHYMKSYTPYENIRPVPYPAILATTSLNDTRVLYVEPAKWIARLREIVPQSPERPIYLHIEMVAGHGGVSGRYGKWRQLAWEYAWMMDQLGVRLQS